MSTLTDFTRPDLIGADRHHDAGQPMFESVTCMADASPAGRTARRQAEQIAAEGGHLRTVAPTPRAWRDRDQLVRLSRESDVVVAMAPVPMSALEGVFCPILISQWLPLGANLGDRIVLVVDQEVDPAAAAGISGALAALHTGSVTVVPTITDGSRLRRSLAQSRRLVLEATGTWPETGGDDRAREAVVAATARKSDASLVVLPRGPGRDSCAAVVAIARQLFCPVLIVPSRNQSGSRRDPHL